ncbi:MAG TPA: GNAT family N-acetyltransferase [Chryseosolibacter sp.]
MTRQIAFISAESESDYATARELFLEYASQLEVDLDFQNFEEEIKGLPTHYGPPHGAVLLLVDHDQTIGCFAIRKFADSIGELKRMYLRKEWQGQGLGKLMLKKAIAIASQLGYSRMRLDTLPTMHSAIRLYTSTGFYEIPPYRFNPIHGTKYFEIQLTTSST